MDNKKKKISLQTQLVKVHRTFPNWRGFIHMNTLTLIGNVKPSALSPNYKIKIQYTLDKNPKVKVISPKLTIHPKRKNLPHTYVGEYLCLHHNEFSKTDDYISETIIIWTTWWLYFYEIWLSTGEWLGGGTHPYTRKIDEVNE
jgi:hypothetical protein